MPYPNITLQYKQHIKINQLKLFYINTHHFDGLLIQSLSKLPKNDFSFFKIDTLCDERKKNEKKTQNTQIVCGKRFQALRVSMLEL